MGNFKKIEKLSNILKLESMQEEIDMILDGYEIVDIDRKSANTTCEFEDEHGNIARMVISKEKIFISKTKEDLVDNIIIDENLFLDEQIIEKRQKGYLVSVIKKLFEDVNGYEQDHILVSVIDSKYLYTRETMNNIIGDNHGSDLSQILTLLNKRTNSFKDMNEDVSCDEEIVFSTRLDYNNLSIVNYQNRTTLNEENVTKYYDYIDGYDMIYRIYMLYQGIANRKTYQDITGIEEGRISKEAFNLMDESGINKIITSVVGNKFNDYKEAIKLKK